MPYRLSDIKPEEVSLVHKGANRRRWALVKSDELEVDETIVKALETPAQGEDELLAKARDAGATDEELRALLAARRLIASAPDEARRILAKRLGIAPAPAPVAKRDRQAPPAEKVDRLEQADERAQERLDSKAIDDLDRMADSIRKADSTLTKEQAFAKAMEERPDLYAAHRRNQERRRGGGSVDIQIGANAEREIDRRAAELVRKSDLTYEQAVGRVLEDDPDLYRRHTTGHVAKALRAERQATAGETGDVRKADEAYTRIEAKAEEIRKSDPTLSKEQAFTKALDENPELYRMYVESR